MLPLPNGSIAKIIKYEGVSAYCRSQWSRLYVCTDYIFNLPETTLTDTRRLVNRKFADLFKSYESDKNIITSPKFLCTIVPYGYITVSCREHSKPNETIKHSANTKQSEHKNPFPPGKGYMEYIICFAIFNFRAKQPDIHALNAYLL